MWQYSELKHLLYIKIGHSFQVWTSTANDKRLAQTFGCRKMITLLFDLNKHFVHDFMSSVASFRSQWPQSAVQLVAYVPHYSQNGR